MAARFYADESFAIRTVFAIRLLGHDVRTVRQDCEDKRGDSMDDSIVLRVATSQERIVLTYNATDFRAEHKRFRKHKGIMLCNPNMDSKKTAKLIDEIVKAGRVDGQVVNVIPPPKKQRPRRIRR